MERYSEYKDSGVEWIGEIPSHWETERIAIHFKENNNKNSKFEFSHAFKFNYGKLVPKNESGEVSEYKKIYEAYTIIDKNDIAINGLNLNYDFVSQRVAISPSKGILTSAYLIITPKQTVYPFYYNYLFKAMDNKKMFHGLGTGIRLTLSFSEIKKQLVILPPLSEQQAIVDYLDNITTKIDKAIAQQQKMIELLNERKQIIISDAVTKGLDKNVTMKDSGVEWIGEIPSHWEICKLKDICRNELYSIKSGPFGSQLKGGDLKEFGDIRVYNQRNVIDDNFTSVKNYVTKEKANELSAFYTKPEDILITSRGTIGKAAVLPPNIEMGILHPCLIAVRSDNNIIEKKYLLYIIDKFNGFKINIKLESNATTIDVIYTETLKNIKLTLPPLSEQQAIATYLDKKCEGIDKALAQQQRMIDLLQERKKIIINDVVTGKIKVS